jgi:hypothetical protein
MAIDREETKNLLFGGLSQRGTSKVLEKQSSHVKDDSSTSKVPKWKTLEKVTVLLTSEQKDAMDETARTLMRFRHKETPSLDDKERITANSVVRAILDNAIERLACLEVRSIRTEEGLREWVASIFK